MSAGDATADDVRTDLAEIKGMLSATLPQHGARLDEHDRGLDRHASSLQMHGERLAVLEATTTERRRTPGWVGVVSTLTGVAALLATIIIVIVTHL